MSFQGFGKDSGPGAPPKSQIPFGGYFPRSPSPSPAQPLFSPPPFHPSFRPIEASPKWGDESKTLSEVYNGQTNQRLSPVTPVVASHNAGTGLPVKSSQVQDQKRNIPLPSLFPDEGSLRNSRTVSGSPSTLQRTNSPLVFENYRSVEAQSSFSSQRPRLSSPVWTNHNKLPSHFANLHNQPDLSSVSPYVDTHQPSNSLTKQDNVHVPKQNRSPPVQYTIEASPKDSVFTPTESKRWNTRSTDRLNTPDSQIHGSFAPSARFINAEVAANKPTSFSIPKRSRSPSLPSSDKSFQGNSYFAQDDTERELQAKAKRLARFKDELSQPEPSSLDFGNQRVSLKGQDQSMVEKRKLIGDPLDVIADYPNASFSSDYEGQDSSSIIIGLCPEMCPESERAERERKGDLDRFERLDGDRNQTSKSLAVKKYTRTAEREANLIRPMPVLQKTMYYLLELLDQPYDAEFLGLYNFLWDRMRAIRMDLRMQHIFNLGAITMLEQMIRLHIIAMHELCEYTKGEGFSEGFDAHLNIEQMNKTSVELFQLYDDHRKNGIDVPTEKEFRGYYALLKLDKHPGYKVEPAELSLDLAKMTPEVRQAPEVLFARDVARSCRIGNFIAFFRLVRKASYLQACLMHAHFAKLRSQALASLHCGLQNNQGIPVAHVAKWLGMEEEDIENLLEYHGFSIKEFGEPYMVKEGPFLNGDKCLTLKCSKLVHMKKSRRMFEDVLSPCLMEPLSSEDVKELSSDKVYEQKLKPVQLSATETSQVNEEMVNFELVSSPKEDMQVKPMLTALVINQQSGNVHQVAAASPSPGDFSLQYLEHRGIGAETANNEIHFQNSPEKNKHSIIKATPQEIMPRRVELERLPVLQMDSTEENLVCSSVFVKDLDDKEITSIHEELENYEVSSTYQDEELAQAKLKLILRIWKRHSSRKRELRKQKQLAADAALSSLSLGPPIRQYQEQPSTSGKFNMHRIMRERHDKHEQSWAKLNVSDVIVGKLSERNTGAKCLCWKVVLCSQMDDPDADKLEQRSQVSGLAAGSWLYSKIMPAGNCDDNDLIISSTGLSIWKKWVQPPLSCGELICCLSIIKDAKYDNLEETVAGASAVLFLIYDCIPLELQKLRLHNLLMSLPSGSCLPLLILSDSCQNYTDPSTIADELGLNEIDKSRISSFLVVFLLENQQTEHLDGFFSDELLREGLQWLASKSPSQPVLQWVKTRELVFTHLNHSLEVQDELNACNVSPVHCIAAFNEALNQSIAEVAAAANSNSSCWPCPEIALLDEYTDERRAVEWYLPNVGWSSAAAIVPLTHALSDCKLPNFPDNISWLFRGSEMGDDIESQRSRLEDCLVRYLTQTSQIMGLSLAKQEARVLLQKCAQLELHESTYYIVPKWVMIFRRVFNWKLMKISNGQLSNAYVLEQHNTAITTSRGLDNIQNEGYTSPHFLIQPSLDEMLQVGCSLLRSSETEAFQPVTTMVLNHNKVLNSTDETEVGENDMSYSQNGNLGDISNTDRFNDTAIESAVVEEATKEADRLSKLLEQCNMVQNMIDKKLSIYF